LKTLCVPPRKNPAIDPDAERVIAQGRTSSKAWA
jgi:hypothetical protein